MTSRPRFRAKASVELLLVLGGVAVVGVASLVYFGDAIARSVGDDVGGSANVAGRRGSGPRAAVAGEAAAGAVARAAESAARVAEAAPGAAWEARLPARGSARWSDLVARVRAGFHPTRGAGAAVLPTGDLFDDALGAWYRGAVLPAAADGAHGASLSPEGAARFGATEAWAGSLLDEALGDGAALEASARRGADAAPPHVHVGADGSLSIHTHSAAADEAGAAPHLRAAADHGAPHAHEHGSGIAGRGELHAHGGGAHWHPATGAVEARVILTGTGLTFSRGALGQRAAGLRTALREANAPPSALTARRGDLLFAGGRGTHPLGARAMHLGPDAGEATAGVATPAAELRFSLLPPAVR